MSKLIRPAAGATQQYPIGTDSADIPDSDLANMRNPAIWDTPPGSFPTDTTDLISRVEALEAGGGGGGGSSNELISGSTDDLAAITAGSRATAAGDLLYLGETATSSGDRPVILMHNLSAAMLAAIQLARAGGNLVIMASTAGELFEADGDMVAPSDASALAVVFDASNDGAVEVWAGGDQLIQAAGGLGTVIQSPDGTKIFTITDAGYTASGNLDNTVAAANSVAYRARVAGNANPRLQIEGDGTFRWGDGTASMDNTLSRIAANKMQLASALRLQRASANDEVLDFTVTGEAAARVSVQASGRIQWGPGSGAVDTNLYRAGADLLRTDDQFSVLRSAAASSAHGVGVTGEAANRHVVQASGLHQWGDGTAAVDTNLYRSAADTLKTDDNFHVALDVEVTDSARGVILKSPNGSRWRVTVDNTGALTSTAL